MKSIHIKVNKVRVKTPISFLDSFIIKEMEHHEDKPTLIADNSKNYVYNFFLTETDTSFGQIPTIEFTAQDTSALIILQGHGPSEIRIVDSKKELHTAGETDGVIATSVKDLHTSDDLRLSAKGLQIGKIYELEIIMQEGKQK